MRAVRVKAARTGRRDSDVIEEALRRDLGFDVLDRLWERADMDEDEAMKLAVEEQHGARKKRRAKARKRQEKRWAAKAGPVKVYYRDPVTGEERERPPD